MPEPLKGRAASESCCPRSHPDFNRRPRNYTVSAQKRSASWGRLCSWVRGLSPPVGNYTQPREFI